MIGLQCGKSRTDRVDRDGIARRLAGQDCALIGIIRHQSRGIHPMTQPQKLPVLLLAAALAGVPGSLLQAAECASAQLVNGLDIDIPCVALDGKQYATGLINQPAGALSWTWNGQLKPVGCSDESRCVQVSNLNLSFPSILINGADYRASLAHAADLGSYAWRYASHSAKTSDAFSSADQQQLAQFISAAIDARQVPGAALAVAVGGQTALLQPYGLANVDTGSPVQEDTLFHIGSTHKAMTSMLIAILVDEGVLSWDSKVVDIYPQFRLADADHRARLTIRQLLDMTSGLPSESDRLTSARQLLENLDQEQTLGAPGGQFEYSNLSVSLAGYLAVVAHTKALRGSIGEQDLNNLNAGYEQLLREKILQPLGMNDSYLYIDEARATGRMASSHELADGAFVVSRSDDQRVDVYAPAGGLKSTAGDMLKFMITEQQQGVTPDGTRLVSSENMAERQRLSPGPATAEDYGLCLEIKTLSNIRYIGHSGSFDNFNSAIGIMPDQDLAFVLLTNGDSEAVLDLTEDGILNRIVQLLKN
jgi:CubicO group peptidase (beta-lactamase class C family)